MSYAVLLLCLVLIESSCSQRTTEAPTTGGVSILQKEDKATSVKPIVIIDDNSTDIEDTEPREGDPLDSAESNQEVRFTFQPADAMRWSRPPPDDTDEEPEGDSPDDDATLKLFQELTSLVDTEMKLMDNSTNDSDTTVTKIKEGNSPDEDDDDSVEDGEDERLPPDADEEQTSDSKPEESQIKRQDDINPFTQNKAPGLDFDQPDRKGEIPAPPPDDVYVTVNDQPDNSNPENDNSPLLQLTQGGYSSPYMFNTETPRVRTQSASQQSETVENPANVNSDEQFRQPQQVSYTDPFQSQFAYASALGLRHPFIPPDSFVNSNGMVHQPVQNGFFNVPPAGFTDFTGDNFQTPFTPSNNGGFQALQRNPGAMSLFQASPENLGHNPAFMVPQTQQYPQTQFLATDPTQSTPSFYQTTGFMNYPGSENANAAPRPDYSSFFRNSPPSNLQYQVNSNPFAPPRNPAGILYNPMIQFQPNFPTRPQYSPQYSPQYPAPNQQIQVQSSAPEDKKEKDLDKISEGETTKTEEQMNTSQNKEDSSVPFGARIQKQNGQESQDDFPPQAEVYMRYPDKVAGYATEESLPVQNTTTKTETKNEPPPSRPVFTFFQGPGQFGDPYRNALSAVQQGFVADSGIRNNEGSNRTKLVQPDQLPPRISYPFSQPALPQPMPGYPDSRSRRPSPMRPPAFFRTLDSPATDPYDQLSLFPDQFSSPLQTGGQSQEASVLPACVHGQSNASMCFEDPEYPKREILFALNSDPFLMDRFSIPDQQLDTISLMDEDRVEHPESADNYICSSNIRYGFPLRAKDVNGKWKVIVNIEKDVGQGRFVQPVRLEVCNGAGDPCNFTQVKTACVQKYNLHRLLAWSAEKGIHNDVFKLPVACSCQLVDAQT